MCFSLTATAMAAESHPIPVDGTDYSEYSTSKSVSTDTEKVESGFIAIREATEEEKAAAAQETKPEIETVASDEISITKATTATWNALDPFTYYAQAYNYSCGAASVRMALKYITGTSYTEATVRTGCGITSTSGTTLANMKTYINSKQSSNLYVTVFGATKTTMKNNIYSGIVTWDAPPIVGLKESTGNGWAFNLAAHAVTIYSILSDKSEVALCDPWAGYYSSTSSYKWVDKTTDDLYAAYSAIDAGYMY